MPYFSNAGGSHFSVEIVNFKKTDNAFNLVVKMKDEFNYDSSTCEVIELSGYYDKKRWKHYKKLITQDIHLQSLELLEKAYLDKKQINLGFIGRGFLKVGNCIYRSKGLFHYEGGIYSVYGVV